MPVVQLRFQFLIPLLGVFLTVEEAEDSKSLLIPRIINLLVREEFDKKGRAAGVIISASNEKSGDSLMYPFHLLLKEISIDQKKTD